MKRLSTRLSLSLIAAGLLSTATFAADPIAVVNGTGIPSTRAEVMMQEQFAQGAQDSLELREAVREELIRREVIAQAATAAGLHESATVQSQMELARQAVLIRAYLQDFVRSNPISDADLEAEYDRIKAGITGQEYLPRHVLVETEEEAKAIIARLRAGEDFAEVAKESLDPGSRDQGGELGWSSPEMYVQPFAEALVALEKGAYSSAPVRSDYGYHVIQLDDVREIEAPPLAEVRPQLEQRVQQAKLEQHMQQLRENAQVQ